MKPIIGLILFIISGEILSQTHGIVLNKDTNTPIPFANIWIANENIGTTSDKNGLFGFKEDIKNKVLIISSIGFEKEQIQVDNSNLKIFLVPKTYTINEIVVAPKRKNEIIIGHYRRSQVVQFTCPRTPQIFARLFPYKDEYENNQFIKSIRIESLSRIESKINLRMFYVSDNGEPGDDILKTNFLIKVKKGRNTISIDTLDKLRIKFPKEGLFIALEYLIIEENEYYFKYYDKDLHKKTQIMGYMPMIGNIRTDNPLNSWVYREGMWKKDLGKKTEELTKDHLSYYLAIELTLTN
jgi:hypothetical protein